MILWLAAVGCTFMVWTGSHREAWAIQLSGVVTDGRNPVPGARVRVHGKSQFVLTDAKGRFELSTSDDPPADYVVTAGKEGWINNGVKISPNTSYTTIILQKVPDGDDPGYEFITPHKSIVDLREDPATLSSLRVSSHTTFKESCNLCHFEPTCYLCHRDLYTQWSTSQHARAVTNPWTQNMYNGTDAEGNENVGPGYRLDFPDKPGECADCHAPTAALRAPGNTDLKVVYNRGVIAYPTLIGYKSIDRARLERKAGSVDADGVHCDFCHKVKSVEVNEKAGVNGSITMARLEIKDEYEKRTSEGRLPPMFVYGPFDDVIGFSTTSASAITSPMVASYNPVYKSSDYCSACHQHRNEHGLPFMDTYQEWKDSPYAALGVQCQDCHMKPDNGLGYGTVVNGDAEKFWTPLEFRDISAVRRHDFPGATKNMVKNAATLAIEAVANQGVLTVKVNVRNVNTGHHLPSGITIRNLLLLVTPVTAGGDTLQYTGNQRVPAYGGTGPVETGHYAGYPGKGFALVFGDDKGNTHVMDWQATRIVEDTRIKARGSDVSVYTFALPPRAGRVEIQTKLIYRRAFKPLADQKKWKMEDMIVASDATIVEPKQGTSALPPPAGLSLRGILSIIGNMLM
jgi:hypothetical protein